MANYDWEKILAGKTDRELYEISKGNSFLPGEARKYALKELEKRNFNFENIEEYNKLWKLASLKEEAESDLLFSDAPKNLRELKTQVFWVTVLSLVLYVFLEYKFSVFSGSFVVIAGIILFLDFIIFLKYWLAKQRRDKRRKEIERLRQEIGQDERKLAKPLKEEWKRQEKKSAETIIAYSRFVAIITAIAIMVYLLFKIVG